MIRAFRPTTSHVSKSSDILVPPEQMVKVISHYNEIGPSATCEKAKLMSSRNRQNVKHRKTKPIPSQHRAWEKNYQKKFHRSKDD
ncbi:hypothetical protein AB6A40_005178 [Gnathostoma spinigerum]|uniref:Uncharacterized protein n=1 Tax=Gnathostoma spinigerum TaxID=75299 RepID=A0ABD6EMC4_9BILA